MKKSKIWIRVCVHLLLFITLGVHSSKFDVNPVTDDTNKLSVLKENIPKDYKIPVHYIPKDEGKMCWVNLNIFYLEQSLQNLTHKFGNISSNKQDISILIQMLQELRLKLGHLEPNMLVFSCHYREERWPTAQYFDFVKEFFRAARNNEFSDDCDPSPCPTTPYTVTTSDHLAGSPPTSSSKGPDCLTSCSTHPGNDKFLAPKVLEQSLLSLLFIPLLALVFLLVWKVRSRRNEEDLQQNPGGRRLTETEGTAPQLDEITEKNKLTHETV